MTFSKARFLETPFKTTLPQVFKGTKVLTGLTSQSKVLETLEIKESVLNESTKLELRVSCWCPSSTNVLTAHEVEALVSFPFSYYTGSSTSSVSMGGV